MAHFHVKKKNGRPYLYVREIARVDGKPKVVSQTYVGSPEKVATLTSSCGGGPIKLRVDSDVLAWFRATGKGYQTRINNVLRAFVESRKNAAR